MSDTDDDFKNFPINKPAPVVSKDKSRQVILVESKWKNSDFIEKIRADVMAFCVICSFDQTSRNLLQNGVILNKILIYNNSIWLPF